MIYFPDTKLRCRDQNIVFFVVKRELRRIEAKMYTEVIQVTSADCFYMDDEECPMGLNFHVCLNFIMIIPLGASSFF